MAGTLNATTNSGQQSTTQNPQVVGQPAVSGASTGSIQPGTRSDLLSGQGSIPLGNQQLTTVSLSSAGNQAPAKQPARAAAGHHFNSFLILITVLLLLVAAGSAAAIHRSAKNTTY
jgi:hypothetical protein